MYTNKLFVFCLLFWSIHAKNEIESAHIYEQYYEHYYANMGTFTCPVIKAYGYISVKNKTCIVVTEYNTTRTSTLIIDEYIHPEYIIFHYIPPPHIIDFIIQLIYGAILTIIRSILVCISLVTFIVSFVLYIH